jgi:transposase
VERHSSTCRLTAPNLNPIELAFAKLKAHLRAAAARTLDALIDRLRAAHDHFLPLHCANFFVHCHYATI